MNLNDHVNCPCAAPVARKVDTIRTSPEDFRLHPGAFLDYATLEDLTVEVCAGRRESMRDCAGKAVAFLVPAARYHALMDMEAKVRALAEGSK